MTISKDILCMKDIMMYHYEVNIGMKFFAIACLSLLAIGSVAVAEENRDDRWHKNIANSNIRLETRDDAQESEMELLRHEDMNRIFPSISTQEGEISLEFVVNDGVPAKESASPTTLPWKWNVSHFSLYQMDDDTQITSTLPISDQVNSTRRDFPFTQENAPVAATIVSSTVANVSVYTEFGITGGDIEEVDTMNVADSGISDDDIDTAINQDLAGYYVSSGANLGVGNWTIGVQAGYETAVGSADVNTQSAGASSTNVSSRELLGSVQSSRPTIVQPQNTQNAIDVEQDPFQFVYFQGSADANVTEKLGLKFGALCFAVPEILVAAFEGKNRSGYGFEIFGDVNYQLGKSLNYTLYLDYALADEYFSEDTIYQILHKVELKF